MTNRTVFVAWSYSERARFRRGISIGDDDDTVHEISDECVAVLDPRAEPFPLSPSSPLSALLRPNVRMELFDGCTVVRISGLTDDEHERVQNALLAEADDQPRESDLWLAGLIKNSLIGEYSSELSRDTSNLRFVASARLHDGVADELAALEASFVPYNGSDGRVVARYVLEVVRDTLQTNKLLVWYGGGSDSVFNFRSADGDRFANKATVAKYRDWLKKSAVFVADNSGNFVYNAASRGAGLFVFSDRRGVCAQGKAVVSTFLRRCERLFVDDIKPLRSAAEVLNMSAVLPMSDTVLARGVRLIDAAGVSFANDLFQQFLALVAESSSTLEAIMLTCSDCDSAMMLRLIERLDANEHSKFRFVMVDTALYIQIPVDARRRVLPATLDSALRQSGQSGLEWEQFVERFDEAHAFARQRFLFPESS